MQIEIIKPVLTVFGQLEKGDALCVDPDYARTLIDLGVAKERSAEVPSTDEAPKKAKKAKKVAE